jgi:RNA polymerase sigma-70 factor (ECF subfamily)
MNTSEEKFAELIDENQGRLRHLCRVYAELVQEERDLFQEIIIQIWRSLPSFEGDENFLHGYIVLA